MKYQIVNKFRVGDNTSVSVVPVPKKLRIGWHFKDDQGRMYKIVGVGMIRPTNSKNRNEQEILVEGYFSGNQVELVDE